MSCRSEIFLPAGKIVYVGEFRLAAIRYTLPIAGIWVMKKNKVLSVLVLILANMVPVIGVFALGWKVFPIMLLFWSENVVIGFFNVLKMLTVRDRREGRSGINVFLVLFFMVHYGMFTMAHGVFVVVLFGGKNVSPEQLFHVAFFARYILKEHLVLPFLSIFISHAFSFVWNYLYRGEYKRTEISRLMTQPYGRIVLLHIGLIFGGMLVTALGSTLYGLLLIITLKIAMDIPLHLREHREKGFVRYGGRIQRPEV